MGGELLGDFSWEVFEAGYEWDPWLCTGPKSDAALIPAFVLGYPSRRYAPLRRYPALFREFAAVTPTQEGILLFANEFGNLREQPLLRDPEGARDSSWSVGGETYAVWRREIFDMRHVVTLWDMVQRGDVDGLSRQIRWDKDERWGKDLVLFDSHPELKPKRKPKPPDERARKLIAFGGGIPESWRHASGQEHFVGPAIDYIQQVTNRDLEGGVSPKLDGGARGGHPTLRYVPNSLSGALWLQVAEAISGKKIYRICEVCGRAFEVRPETTRSDRVYCRAACRTRAYRTRQDKARQMYAAGKTLRAIAKELGSDIETVKKWVTDPDER